MKLLLLLVSGVRVVLSSCGHGTVIHPRTVVDEVVELPNFGYGSFDGPVNWHSISPDNFLCAVGKSQSPIDIDGTISQESPGYISLNVPVQNVTFENLGTNVEVVTAGTSTIGGRIFNLEQFHFHTPSEHLVHGRHFASEVHMVQTAKGEPDFLLIHITHVTAHVKPNS